ncbi:hypothetical protein NYZ99_01460 [Maribacter litopenaei]|uniref:Uncharacterized protein n=1 Tax=Maribacter litopenaei TaxID=2976127 RepID=A0ABY5Y8F1_9FLAO|nr:hypothetical protein [Maribacter litopenaei]UWX55301.1 hypothetical protein NYZ99_01460 [Maribacter litopenaei]
MAISGMFDVPGMFNISESAALVYCIWGIGIIGSIYAVFGGLKAVAVSDSINAIGLIIGGIMIPVFGLMAIGDGSVTQGLDVLMTANPRAIRLNRGKGSRGSFCDHIHGYDVGAVILLGYQPTDYTKGLGR